MSWQPIARSSTPTDARRSSSSGSKIRGTIDRIAQVFAHAMTAAPGSDAFPPAPFGGAPVMRRPAAPVRTTPRKSGGGKQEATLSERTSGILCRRFFAKARIAPRPRRLSIESSRSAPIGRMPNCPQTPYPEPANSDRTKSLHAMRNNPQILSHKHLRSS